MKNRRWSDYLEYASIVGLGVGSVATLLSKQVLYTSAPLSIAVLMNLINRQRLERWTEQQTQSIFSELDQRLTKHIELLNQQVAELPTPEMVGSMRSSILRHNREKLEEMQTRITTMQREVIQRVSQLERQNVGTLQQEVNYLHDQYTEIHASLANLHGSVQRLMSTNRMGDAEKAIAQLKTDATTLQVTLQDLSDQFKLSHSDLDNRLTYLSRQFRSLPPPVDPTSLREELAELTRMIADLVPKRDLNTLQEQMRTLQRQHESQTETGEHLQQEMQEVRRRLQSLPDLPQFRSQIEETLNRELRVLNQQLRTLPNAPQFRAQIEETLRRELQDINEQLQALPEVPPYEFVFDLKASIAEVNSPNIPIAGSRVVLEEALEKTRQRLILIWPWSSHCSLDERLIEQFHQLLRRNCHLDLGWCHTTDPREERFLKPVSRQWGLDPLQQSEIQATLKEFLKLKRMYPQHFRFKVLGTVENFLVSDQSFAVLGIEDALNTATVFQNVELKLRTTDDEVIQRLIQRFEDPSLDQDDIRAFWNRAVTRYELGDKSGAIADLNCLLAVDSNHASALNMLGIVRHDRGDKAGAVEEFTESINLDPYQVAAYCNRGFVRSELGDQYGAIADYSLATQVQPDSGIAYFYRGLACQNLDDYEGAIADYNQAIWFAPDSAVAHYYRGMAHRHQQDYQTAVDDFEAAAHLFTRQGHQTNAQRALNAIKKCQQEAAALSSVQESESHEPRSVQDVDDDDDPLPASRDRERGDGVSASSDAPGEARNLVQRAEDWGDRSQTLADFCLGDDDDDVTEIATSVPLPANSDPAKSRFSEPPDRLEPMDSEPTPAESNGLESSGFPPASEFWSPAADFERSNTFLMPPGVASPAGGHGYDSPPHTLEDFFAHVDEIGAEADADLAFMDGTQTLEQFSLTLQVDLEEAEDYPTHLRSRRWMTSREGEGEPHSADQTDPVDLGVETLEQFFGDIPPHSRPTPVN